MDRRQVWRSVAALMLLGGLTAGAASAADKDGSMEGDKATVTQERAAEIALERVPGGRIVEAELEREHGHLVWSFDIARPGSKDVSEIQVDAHSGEVVAEENETPDHEASEDANPKK